MNKATVFLLLLATTLTINAQREILVVQSIQPFSKGEQTSYQVVIPEATLKDVESDWKKTLKQKSKGKVEEQNGELFIYGAVDKNVAADGFNVFSKLLETTEGVVLKAWFMRNDSTFISRETAADKSLAVEKYLHDFAVEEYKEVVEGQVRAENKVLADLETELKQLINEEEKAHKKGNVNERSIDRTKSEIKINESDQKVKMEQITKQKTVVESLKNTPGDAYKEAEKTLKQMENEWKKLIKENEKLHKQIDKWEAEIREEQRSVDKSRQDQYQKRADIDKQKTVVKAMEEKLNNIK